jgi:hypothetical protein
MKRRGRLLAGAMLLWSVLSFLPAHAQEEEEGPKVMEAIPSDSLFYEQSTSASRNYFDPITDTRPVEERQISKSELEKVRSDGAYWYANLAPERKEEKPKPGFTDSTLFKTIFWILLIGAFVALLIWFLATSNIRLFQRKSKPLAVGSEETEELTEDIFEMNFEREIEKALAAQNYRLAVRLYYLQTLRRLSDRGLINYSHEKTNSDYLFQLAGSHHYRSFFRITRNFEYVWYGKLDVSRELFAIIQKDFTSFKQQMG